MYSVLTMLDLAADTFGTKTYVSNKENDNWKDYSFLKVRELSTYVGSFLLNIGIEKEDNIVILS